MHCDVHNVSIPYAWKFLLDTNFAKHSYPETFGGINFRQCDKGCHIYTQCHRIKNSVTDTMIAGGKIGENLS